MTRIAAGSSILLAALLAWATACSDSTGLVKPPTPVGVFPGLIVSQPIRPAAAGRGAGVFSSASSGGSLVYVSLVPGTVPTGLLATIRDHENGQSVTAPIVDGGFDPVALAAGLGDTLLVEITRSGSVGSLRAVELVRSSHPPVVVRTSPPAGGRDVPLNTAIIIVISEPVDSATVTTASVRLVKDTTSVAGRVEFRDQAHLTVGFVPAARLSGSTTYQLFVTRGVAGLDGEPLDAALQVAFSTGASPAGPHLEFIEEPASAMANATLNQGGSVLVAIRDSLGNTITTATDSVTVAIGHNPNGGTLGGTRTRTAYQGVAQFTDLRLDKTSDPDPTGYTLTASAVGYTGATSTGFRITPSTAVALAFVYRPVNAIAGAPMGELVLVAPVDPAGNFLWSYNVTVTLALGANPGNGSLSGAISSGGAFEALRIDQPGRGYTLVASAAGLTSATSPSFDVAPPIGPTTSTIVFTHVGDPPGLSVVEADNGGMTPLNPSYSAVHEPAWSPDGTRLVVAQELFTGDNVGPATTEIAVMNADGSDVNTLTDDTTDQLDHPSWSPDGTKIAFDGSRAGVYGIRVMNVDGTGITYLTEGRYPSWSHDGSKLAFQGPTGGVYVMNADGSGATQISALIGYPRWAPIGSRIAVAAGDIYLINADGSNLVQLTHLGGTIGIGGPPTWSPDGSRIAFSGGNYTWSNPQQLYVVGADGSGLTVLVPAAKGGGMAWSYNIEPAWRP